MKCLVGKMVNFEAVVGVSAPSTCGTKTMVCLEWYEYGLGEVV